jgi:dTDP-4-amino-4,6-dideoxygalactose transaminase
MQRNKIKKIKIKTFSDTRGKLSALEISKQYKFNVKRIYYLHDLNTKFRRGQHAHKDLKQCIICINGAIKINFDTGKKEISHNLSHANEAILVEGVVWRDIEIKKKNSIILILASEQYRKSDYIKNKIDFSKFIKNNKKNIIVKYNCLDRCHKELNYKFLNAFENILSNNKYILANEVQRFEKKFAKFSNAKYAATCGNGYDALVLALRALNINTSDEIIVPANSFVATAMAVTNVGAKPVFVDCNENDYSINLKDLERKITKRTKVIIPVSLYGIPLDIEKINKIVRKHNLLVVEDASQSHGASFFSNKKFNYKTYSNWKISTFSFYPTKNLGALGDAGAILTNDKDLLSKIKLLRNYGSVKKYNHEIIGINSRLDEIQASFLNIKLKYLRKWILKKRKIAKIYFKELKSIKRIKMLNPEIINKSVLHIFPIRVLNNQRGQFIDYLNKNNIETNIHYPISINNQAPYRKFKSKVLNCDIIQNQIVSLPIDPYHNVDEILYVCKKIKEFYGKE